jgi:hypothetical protein
MPSDELIALIAFGVCLHILVGLCAVGQHVKRHRSQRRK